MTCFFDMLFSTLAFQVIAFLLSCMCSSCPCLQVCMLCEDIPLFNLLFFLVLKVFSPMLWPTITLIPFSLSCWTLSYAVSYAQQFCFKNFLLDQPWIYSKNLLGDVRSCGNRNAKNTFSYTVMYRIFLVFLLVWGFLGVVF